MFGQYGVHGGVGRPLLRQPTHWVRDGRPHERTPPDNRIKSVQTNAPGAAVVDKTTADKSG